MHKLMRWSFERPWWVIVFIAALSIMMLFPLSKLRMDVSSEGFMADIGPSKEVYETAKKIFGSDISAVIYVRDPQLFTREKLDKLRAMYDELANLPNVEKADSLFSVNNIRNDDGMVSTEPLLNWIPDDPAEVGAKQQEALANPILQRNLISQDGTATLISLFLVKGKENLDFNRSVAANVDAVLVKYRGDFAELFQTGSPHVTASMARLIIEDQRVMVPLALVVMLASIMVTLRTRHGAIIPVINTSISILWTLGVMGLFGIPINLLTAIVPILIIIIGSSEDVHIISEFMEQKQKNSDSFQVIEGLGKKIHLAILLTTLSTALGFASIIFNDIVVMRQFGIVATASILLNFIITVTLTPVYLRFFGANLCAQPRESSRFVKLIDKAGLRVMHWAQNKRRMVIVVFSALAVLLLIPISQIKFNNDVLSYFKPDSPLVQESETLHQQLVGSKTVYVVLSREPGDFRLAKNLKAAEEVENHLKSFKQFDSVLGLVDYLSLVNKEMNDGNATFHRVPDSDNLIAQYLLFFQRSDLQRYVSADSSKINFVIHHNIHSSTDLNRVLAQIQAELKSGRFGKFEVNITGQGVLIAESADSIAEGQTLSLSSSVLTLFGMMTLLFISFKGGAVGVIPNVFPAIIFFGFLGLTGIPLSVGTSMVAAITLGIAVDDSIRTMVRYNGNLKLYGNEQRALHETWHAEIIPMIITTISLTAGFLVLSFSSFVPVAQFGQCSAFVLAVALLCEFILMPTLLSSVRLITLWDALTLELRNSLINNSPLFQGMSKWQIRRTILLTRLMEFPAGHQVVRDGEIGRNMYVVVTGRLNVSKVSDGRPVHIKTLEAGDVVGEMALINEAPRTADVFAETDTKLLSLDWATLKRLKKLSPFISANLFLNISKILGDRLAEATHWIHLGDQPGNTMHEKALPSISAAELAQS